MLCDRDKPRRFPPFQSNPAVLRDPRGAVAVTHVSM
jgi:hypothetical protein